MEPASQLRVRVDLSGCAPLVNELGEWGEVAEFGRGHDRPRELAVGAGARSPATTLDARRSNPQPARAKA